MSTSGTFTQFLFDRAIISKQQADVLNSSLRDGDEGKCINAMTDFFSSMSPSDSYDLAFRLFMAWVKTSSIPPSRQDTTEESIRLTPNHSKTPSRKANNEQSNSARNKRSTSPTFNDVRSRMNTNSSNNLGNYYSAQSSGRSGSVFNKLYNDAHKKTFMRQEYDEFKYRAETEECTFQPNSRRSPKRTNGEVFERLQQDIRRFKQEINENKRQEIEMRNCTFSPTINSSSMLDGESSLRSINHTFEKLYNDKKLKELHTYENEMRKHEKELADCTFKPVLSPGTLNSYSKLDDSDTERFHRLYKNHEEKQRRAEQKIRDKSMEENSKYSFKPQRIASPTPGRGKEPKNEKKVVDRLLDWYNDRKKKIDTKVVQQERKITEDANASLSTKRRKRDLDETAESIPAYDRLYKQYSNKKSRNEALEKKVMKQIGASFTPKINRTRSLSSSSRGNETLTYHSRAVNNTRPTSPVREMVTYGRKNNSIQYQSVNELVRGSK